MPDLPAWAWGCFYGLAGAANATWYLPELRRNRVLQGRVGSLAEVLEPLFTPAFVRGLFVTSMVLAWPVALLAALICDVPGHGKNLTDDERTEIERS
ncbi:hypothetical protein FLW53_09390 [Microbispora sp. SCL1-1]|uniref:hypothetical protein n=1 Tax=unclassified Microbispora TaxID=2614687 RepID=UPI0011599425|nr:MULTISPECIES: hypothetical protein [unclassified Microbispora]NJP24415.1 hypothetical protein [Microbispora sp. CL1-1]TQS14566.1 hypothetical protein FLW53_09390 [Microbispora sp. SCL1-1]